MTISAEQTDEGLVVRVRDNGIGISEKDLERVFHTFEQVDASRSRRHDGTGLGLALSRQLVQLHGGRIWAESDGKDKGSAFSFVIPLSPPLSTELPESVNGFAGTAARPDLASDSPSDEPSGGS